MEITTKELMNIKHITTTEEEKETIININSEGVSVYTTDSVWLRKLQKINSEVPGLIKSINETHNREKQVTSVDCEFELSGLRISIGPKRQIKLSEEEKLIRAERLRQNRN